MSKQGLLISMVAAAGLGLGGYFWFDKNQDDSRLRVFCESLVIGQPIELQTTLGQLSDDDFDISEEASINDDTSLIDPQTPRTHHVRASSTGIPEHSCEFTVRNEVILDKKWE